MRSPDGWTEGQSPPAACWPILEVSESWKTRGARKAGKKIAASAFQNVHVGVHEDSWLIRGVTVSVNPCQWWRCITWEWTSAARSWARETQTLWKSDMFWAADTPTEDENCIYGINSVCVAVVSRKGCHDGVNRWCSFWREAHVNMAQYETPTHGHRWQSYPYGIDFFLYMLSVQTKAGMPNPIPTCPFFRLWAHMKLWLCLLGSMTAKPNSCYVSPLSLCENMAIVLSNSIQIIIGVLPTGTFS